jgi:nitroreductase
MELGLHDALEAVRLAPSAVNKQPWRVVIRKNAAHFYVKHDKGYLTPDYDLQKIDLGIGMYHFEQELLEEGKKPVVIIDEPDIDKPDDVEYVATFKW